MSLIKVKDCSPPTRDILYNKGIADLNLCRSYPETVEHLVIKCDLARRVWFSFIGVEVNRWTFGSPIRNYWATCGSWSIQHNVPCKNFVLKILVLFWWEIESIELLPLQNEPISQQKLLANIYHRSKVYPHHSSCSHLLFNTRRYVLSQN